MYIPVTYRYYDKINIIITIADKPALKERFFVKKAVEPLISDLLGSESRPDKPTFCENRKLKPPVMSCMDQLSKTLLFTGTDLYSASSALMSTSRGNNFHLISRSDQKMESGFEGFLLYQTKEFLVYTHSFINLSKLVLLNNSLQIQQH